MDWYILPEDQGKPTYYEYAVIDVYLYRRFIDKSKGDMPQHVERAEWECGEFAPWEGVLPETGPWHSVQQ